MQHVDKIKLKAVRVLKGMKINRSINYYKQKLMYIKLSLRVCSGRRHIAVVDHTSSATPTSLRQTVSMFLTNLQ